MALDTNGNFISDVAVQDAETPVDLTQGLYGRPLSDPNWAKWFDLVKQAGVNKFAPVRPSMNGLLLASNRPNDPLYDAAVKQAQGGN